MSALIRYILLVSIVSWQALNGSTAWAEDYFVSETLAGNGIDEETARVATRLVKSAVSARPSDTVTGSEAGADYVLQPRLMRLGTSYILTVEKIHGAETLFAAQSKIAQLDQLDRAAFNVTTSAIEEPTYGRRPQRGIASEPRPAVPFQQESRTPASSPRAASGEGRSVAPGVSALPLGRKVGYWSVGVGPFLSNRLETDNFMYNLLIGHTWDINPYVSLKVLGEANLSSGTGGARFLNFATGATYFLPSVSNNSPYVTADIGYGFAEDRTDDTAEGFSLGTGVGYQFFRNTETTLDLLLRFATILDPIDGEGNPSVVGVRLAVNF